MAWSADRLIVADGKATVRLYDVWSIARPTLLHESRAGSRIEAIAISASRAVVAAGDGGVLLFTPTPAVLPAMGEKAFLPIAACP